jgi:hypothetical protein
MEARLYDFPEIVHFAHTNKSANPISHASFINPRYSPNETTLRLDIEYQRLS